MDELRQYSEDYASWVAELEEVKAAHDAAKRAYEECLSENFLRVMKNYQWVATAMGIQASPSDFPFPLIEDDFGVVLEGEIWAHFFRAPDGMLIITITNCGKPELHMGCEMVKALSIYKWAMHKGLMVHPHELFYDTQGIVDKEIDRLGKYINNVSQARKKLKDAKRETLEAMRFFKAQTKKLAKDAK